MRSAHANGHLDLPKPQRLQRTPRDESNDQDGITDRINSQRHDHSHGICGAAPVATQLPVRHRPRSPPGESRRDSKYPSGDRYTVTARAGSRSICTLALTWVPRLTHKTGNAAFSGLIEAGPPHYSCIVGWPEHHSDLHNGRCLKGNGGFAWVGIGPDGLPGGL